jgi:hypothetical protein
MEVGEKREQEDGTALERTYSQMVVLNVLEMIRTSEELPAVSSKESAGTSVLEEQEHLRDQLTMHQTTLDSTKSVLNSL